MMKMRIVWMSVMAFCMLTCPMIFAQGQDDIQAHPTCKYCGMDRQQFAHSRMLIEYEDGTSTAVCSIHCAAIDVAVNMGKMPKTLHVGDFNTKKLINAESATWVIGNKPGVMTKRAKWAYEKKEDAESFVKENGGAVSTFEQAMKASYEDMYSDTQMIREKRKMKRMQSMENKPQ